jgi:hypothetical protein
LLIGNPSLDQLCDSPNHVIRQDIKGVTVPGSFAALFAHDNVLYRSKAKIPKTEFPNGVSRTGDDATHLPLQGMHGAIRTWASPILATMDALGPLF